MQNIVITGMGFVTSLGCDAEAILESIRKNDSSIKEYDVTTLSEESIKVWNGRVETFDSTKYIPKKKQ